MTERKSFQNLPGEENPHFLEHGRKIYLELVEKYGTNSVEGLDSILNILCVCLVCLAKSTVNKDNHTCFLQLVYNILSTNLTNEQPKESDTFYGNDG